MAESLRSIPAPARLSAILYLALALALLRSTPVASQQDESTPAELISISAEGQAANGWSGWPAGSGDGMQVVFVSLANNLIEQDNNHVADIFLRDRSANRTRRLSVSSQAQEANAASFQPAISADGRLVVFTSLAGNLTGPYEPPDTNGLADIYLHDRDFATTQRISLAQDGQQLIGWSDQPAISASGRYIVYASTAQGLVQEDQDHRTDIFLYDHQKGETSLVSNLPGGDTGEALMPAISADGRYIAYFYRSEGRMVLYQYDQVSRHTREIPAAAGSGSILPPGWRNSPPALSPDGSWLWWLIFNHNQATIFRYERQSGTSTRLQDIAFFSLTPLLPTMTFSADSQQAILSLGGSVYRFESEAGSGEKMQDIEASPVFSQPVDAAISLDGRSLVFAALDARGQAIYSIEQRAIFQARSVVSGWVSDQSGDPLEGIVVTAGEEIQTTTLSDGSYSFLDLPDGEYTIIPLLEGFSFSPPRWRITLSAGGTSGLGLGFMTLPPASRVASPAGFGVLNVQR